MNENIIFYFGTAIITTFFIGLIILKFKDDEEIDLKKNKWLIITYIALLVFGIYIWGVLNKIFTTNMQKFKNYNKKVEEFKIG